ncbi:MAG: DUF1203 domain-containing protein [Chthoniobacterales bacterium]|nr:DUF1203 domain-containing protein [Chthoniobacterales bacterium]
MRKSSYQIVPLPTEVAQAARLRVQEDASDHRLVRAEMPRTYPCRHCLRWAQPGEDVVLFPYSSIPAGHPYAESGPIFVHADACERYHSTDEYPDAFREGRVMRAYDKSYDMIAAEFPDANAPESLIEKLLAHPATAFLQVHSLDRGCYTFRIERA